MNFFPWRPSPVHPKKTKQQRRESVWNFYFTDFVVVVVSIFSPRFVFFSFLTSPFEWSAVPTIDFDLNEWQCHHQTVSFLLVNDVKKWKEKTKKKE